MKYMIKKKFLSLVFASLFLSACTSTQLKITQNELFQGYPCLDNCVNFQSGYESARDQYFVRDSQCYNLPKTNQLGCLSYMHEYHLLHDQPQGYSFGSR